MIDRVAFPLIFRSDACLSNLAGLIPAFQRLYPMTTAVPLFAPEGLVQVGALAPLGLSASWALPLCSVAGKFLSFLKLPSRPLKPSWLPTKTPGTPGS